MRSSARVTRFLVVAVLAAGCGDDARGGGDADVTAVATTMHVADLVREVGGERVAVDAILEAGADPHGYEPAPSDVKALSAADVVLKSGGEFDAWLDEVVENAGGDARPVTLLDAVETIEGGQRHEPDPHWWQNPLNAMRAVDAIQEELAAADPAGRELYARNAERYKRELRRLDAEIERCMGRLPDAKRKLVTTHDALGYFAHRYEIEIIGSVIPSLSTQAQASARDVDRLVEQIRDERVEAIFPESAVNPKLEKAISREAGAEVGRKLWTDSLASEGPAATYVGAMRENADALAEGMSRGALRC